MTPADPRRAARRRHPSARTPVCGAALAARLVDVLARGGARHPEVAAAVLADRGVMGTSPTEYAGSLGVDLEVVSRAESGELAPDELPAPLRRILVAGR